MNFSDSCGIGDYGIDIHQCYGPPGTPWVGGITVRPFQIPLGALIPSDVTNLIMACKNIGTTHLTGGAYRVHPAEWAVGEAAGTFAAYCVGQAVSSGASARERLAHRCPAIAPARARRADLLVGRPGLRRDPKTFAAANLLGVRGYMSDPNSLHFRPGDTISQSERDAVNSHAGRQLPWPSRR